MVEYKPVKLNRYQLCDECNKFLTKEERKKVPRWDTHHRRYAHFWVHSLYDIHEYAYPYLKQIYLDNK
jgi:hypothetical protein